MTSALPRTLSVLLVEDSLADGRLLLEALKPAITAGEIIVQTVKTLTLAVDALKGSDFSCVLLDIGLPDGRGVDNVRTLREVDRKTAILVLTGIADEKLAAEALNLGAQEYLVKGENDGEQLLKHVRRAVQRNRQTYALETRRDQAFFEASHDALTLLPNAALFTDRARVQLAAARLAGQSFAIAILHLNGVDAARRHHGLEVAQALLLKVSQLLVDNLPGGSTLARIGETEFALLSTVEMTATRLTDWLQYCESCVDALRQLDDCAVTPKLTTGSAIDGRADDTLESLLNAARNFMGTQAAAEHGESKPESGNGVPVSIGRQSRGLLARWQPWIDVGSQRCVGLQMHAESTQAISGHGEQPTEHLLASIDALGRQWREWAKVYFTPDVIALSVPVEAIEQDGFASTLANHLSRCGVPASRIQLEISESVFRNLAPNGAALNRLRSGGFRLFMAGDGSIETTLSDFSAFPLDGFKLSAGIVQLLVQQGFQGPARRLVSAVCGAAHALSASVIASGVDSQECAAALQLIGLRYLQGRALLPPLETEAVSMAWERPVNLRK